MRKLTAAFGFLLYASTLFAQSTTLLGELVVSNLTLTGVSHLSNAERQSIIKEVQSRCV